MVSLLTKFKSGKSGKVNGKSDGIDREACKVRVTRERLGTGVKADGVSAGRFDSESSLFRKWEATERKEIKTTLDVELIDRAQEWKPFPLCYVESSNSSFQL